MENEEKKKVAILLLEKELVKQDSIEGKQNEVQMLSMEFRKTMFDSAYEYLRKQGPHARPDITKHDFLCGYLQCHNDNFKAVGKLEEKEEPVTFENFFNDFMESYAFVVPYDGSDNFYDEKRLKDVEVKSALKTVFEKYVKGGSL